MPYIEIHVRGSLDASLSDWFQGISIQPISAQESCLCCADMDSAAIYGLLSTLSSLGLSLISVSVTD